MPKRPIIRIIDEPEDDIWFLAYSDEYDYIPESQRDLHPVLTLEELADFCDQNAESANNHDYVGTHRILAAVLHRLLGREQATSILQEIAEYGGLDEMSGVGGKRDAFKEFGISDCWNDWSLQ